MKKILLAIAAALLPIPSAKAEERAGEAQVLRVCDQLMVCEGFSETAYVDNRRLSIGYGHQLKSGEDFKTISRDGAWHLLRSDVREARAGAARVFESWAKLSPNIQDALIGLVFQVGTTGAAKFVDMRAAIKKGDWTAAALAAADSKLSKQTPKRVSLLLLAFLREQK